MPMITDQKYSFINDRVGAKRSREIKTQLPLFGMCASSSSATLARRNVALLLIVAQTINSFQISQFAARNFNDRRQSFLSMKSEIAPRKALFFEIVESGLKDRFKGDEIPRVFKFCQYAKSEIPAPSAKVMKHDPCEEYIEGLTAQPWWEASQFEWVAGLEEKSAVIAEELRAVLATEELFKGDSRYMSTMGEGWTAFRLQRLGQWNEANTRTFPLTTEIIRGLNIPLAVRGVMFAKQAPDSGVKPHSDGRNFILTAHLGVSVPKEGCSITVGGEKRSWEQDKVLVFDTSFTHETDNNSAEDRYVVIIDFWHPELTPEERVALDFVYDTRNKFETGKADEIDCTYVNSGLPTDVNAYIKSKQGFGKSFVDFFSDGGLIKFNPFK